jgi:O-antigen/teichoic acid export membrane protein
LLKRFVGDALTYTAGNILVRGVSIVLVPFYTRVLTPGDYGALDMLTVLAGLINVTVALEISQGLARHLPASSSENETRGFASTALWFAFGAYTLFMIAGLLTAGWLASVVLGAGGSVYLLRVAVMSIWMNGIFYLVQNQLRFTLRPAAYSVAGFVYALVSLGVAVILVLGYRLGVAGFFYGQIAGAVAGLGVGFYYTRHSYGLTFDRARLREMLAFSIPLVPSSLGVFGMVYVDRMAIRKLMTLHDVGLYGVGYRLVSIIAILLIGVQRAIVPLVFSRYKEKETPGQLARIFRLFVAAGLVMWAGVTLFSHEILAVFTTPEFYEGAKVASLLAGATLVSNMYMFMPGLDIEKKTSVVGILNLTGAVLNTALNFALIPQLGIRGSAAATLISSAIVFAGYSVMSQRHYPVPHDWARLAVVTIPAIALTSFIASLSAAAWEFAAAKILGFAAVVLLIVVAKLVTPDELSRGAAGFGSLVSRVRPRIASEPS